ncbi:MAG TPA: hypothetical protein DHW82_13490 [Spirochaetia bacterium]|nr:MAG: hypothetical protein A2Y41_00630 [Spirochaetes bacterium GWB1_36_13]HCL58003.1 hypothetical protein [Spirochaetia bacterium]
MNLVNLDKVSKTQGDKKLFENISFGMNDGDKIALIGINGSGKSTLLKMIAGIENPDNGTIARNRALKISFLPQVPLFQPENTILEHILKSNDPKILLIREYEQWTEKIKKSPDNESLQKKLMEIMHRMDQEDVWGFEREIRSILDQFGLDDLEIKMGSLSGGMLKKVALAQSLVLDSQLLILDEPTNHLDLQMIDWLEKYLCEKSKTVIMVTHDRYFLDRVCNQIIEIDHEKIYTFNGNYSYYLEKKTEIENSFQAENERIASILRKEMVWLRRGVLARGTKQQARIDRITEMQNRKKIEEKENLELGVLGRRLGNKILELLNVSKSFDGKPVIKDFTYTFKKNERIGIIGPNGSGKSTLLNLITGKIKEDSGKIDSGQNTFFGLFDQNAIDLNPEERVIDFIRNTAEHITLNNGETLSAGKMLERFLFTAKQQSSPIEKLSGGERRRLYMLHVLMKNPNFLLLDEPTNDLDIKTLSILEDFLETFPGCVVAVSHDRYFMDRIAGLLLVFDGKTNITLFPGNYSEYLESQESETLQSEKSKTLPKKIEPKKEKEKTKLSYHEKREYEKIEKEIEVLEKEKSEIEERFGSGSWQEDLALRHKELEKILQEKMNRWEYLSSFEE